MSAHIEWLAAAETSVQVFTPGEDWVGAGHVYYDGSVERPFLERLLGARAEAVLAYATDLLPVVREHYFSGAGYGLKKLGRLAGLRGGPTAGRPHLP